MLIKTYWKNGRSEFSSSRAVTLVPLILYQSPPPLKPTLSLPKRLDVAGWKTWVRSMILYFLGNWTIKHEKSSPLVTETQRMYKKYVSCWGQRAHYKLRPFGRQLLEKNGPMECWAMIMAHCAEISQTFATESWVLHKIQSY